jgi:hypothetical protein
MNLSDGVLGKKYFLGKGMYLQSIEEKLHVFFFSRYRKGICLNPITKIRLVGWLKV